MSQSQELEQRHQVGAHVGGETSLNETTGVVRVCAGCAVLRCITSWCQLCECERVRSSAFDQVLDFKQRATVTITADGFTVTVEEARTLLGMF